MRITLVLVATNEVHNLIWERFDANPSGTLPSVTPIYGAGFWLQTALLFLWLLVGTALVGSRLLEARHLYRRQAAAILVAVLAPWIGNPVSIRPRSPSPPAAWPSPGRWSATGCLIWCRWRVPPSWTA